MADRIETLIIIGDDSDEGKWWKKTYMLTEFKIRLLVESNEILWADYHESRLFFCTHEKVIFTKEGEVSHMELFLLPTLENGGEGTQIFREHDAEEAEAHPS